MTKVKNIVHPIKKEFCRKKCGFDHTSAEDFVKSQWQSRTKSVAYLIYRWIIALFFVAVVIQSMYESVLDDSSIGLYFIYMTNWGVIMCMLTNMLVAVLVTIWHYHPEYADKLINMESLTSPFRIYWGMHIITMVSSIVITIIYWSILYNPEEAELSTANILTHAFNSVTMFIDLLIVAHPLRLLHMFLPVLFGGIYSIFSIIYQSCGGLNKKGKPFIYHVLDWREPLNAIKTMLGVLLLCCCVSVFLFTIYKLRLVLYRRMHKSCSFLPTTVTGNGNNGQLQAKGNERGSGIQHSPSGISMVLGNVSAYQNQAFSATGENITKY